ncbi:hypothetical protein OAT84_00175 [Gammaproteobacteria bacterium]|nr:hypothetical protein [Gammaproteobacteria bacterium]
MTMHRTLKQLWIVFLLPLTIGLVLALFGYVGTPKNKGEWVTPHLPLDVFTSIPPNTKYQWTVLYPCKDCIHADITASALVTLGTKQPLVKLLIPKSLTQIDEEHLFLADPHQHIILKYPASDPLALVSDLKRLLKTVSQ